MIYNNYDRNKKDAISIIHKAIDETMILTKPNIKWDNIKGLAKVK